MKHKVLTLLLLPFTLFLSQCDELDNLEPPSYDGPHESTFQKGLERGRYDGRTGLSRSPGRYAGSYPPYESTAFLDGYEGGYNQGIRPPQNSGYGQPLRLEKLQGRITIYEGSRALATCRTAAPNVESTRFINQQQQVVVKSRGNHGPATVQLFNSRTGAEEGRVMAFAIRNGQPRWAAGLGE
ncbi:MAG: hypothetical protein L3J39_04570 [Verrucomicrobiales bacterium]|nr:hypothetical protein [Verrucomicrobiales bacterium]